MPGPATTGSRNGGLAADLKQIGSTQGRQRPRLCLEIVEQMNGAKAELPLQLGRIELPIAVGENSPAVLDRTRNGNDRSGVAGSNIMASHNLADRQLCTRMISDLQAFDRSDTVAIEARKARIGAAYICQQCLIDPRHRLRVAPFIAAQPVRSRRHRLPCPVNAGRPRSGSRTTALTPWEHA